MCRVGYCPGFEASAEDLVRTDQGREAEKQSFQENGVASPLSCSWVSRNGLDAGSRRGGHPNVVYGGMQRPRRPHKSATGREAIFHFQCCGLEFFFSIFIQL